MIRIATTPDTSASSTQNRRTPAEDPGSRRATAAAPRQRLLDRISEAVRAAHAASVPF